MLSEEMGEGEEDDGDDDDEEEHEAARAEHQKYQPVGSSVWKPVKSKFWSSHRRCGHSLHSAHIPGFVNWKHSICNCYPNCL